jgi:hypothetical protein
LYGIKNKFSALRNPSTSYTCRIQFLAFLRDCADSTALFGKDDCKNINANDVDYAEVIKTLSREIFCLFFSNLEMHKNNLDPNAIVEEKTIRVILQLQNNNKKKHNNHLHADYNKTSLQNEEDEGFIKTQKIKKKRYLLLTLKNLKLIFYFYSYIQRCKKIIKRRYSK